MSSERGRDIQHAEDRIKALEHRKQTLLVEIEVYKSRMDAELFVLEQEIEGLSKVVSFLSEWENDEKPPEYVNGVDVSRLDHETRAMVVAGNVDTIALLSRKSPDSGSVERL